MNVSLTPAVHGCRRDCVCPCHGDAEEPGPHLPACSFADPTHEHELITETLRDACFNAADRRITDSILPPGHRICIGAVTMPIDTCECTLGPCLAGAERERDAIAAENARLKVTPDELRAERDALAAEVERLKEAASEHNRKVRYDLRYRYLVTGLRHNVSVLAKQLSEAVQEMGRDRADKRKALTERDGLLTENRSLKARVTELEKCMAQTGPVRCLELEEENARLRAALQEIADLDPGASLPSLLAQRALDGAR